MEAVTVGAKRGTETGPMGGWSRGGGWNGSIRNSASNQLLAVVNVHNTRILSADFTENTTCIY